MGVRQRRKEGPEKGRPRLDLFYVGEGLLKLCFFFWSEFTVGNFWEVYKSGQIIATSHDLTSKGSSGREIPLFQEIPGW